MMTGGLAGSRACDGTDAVSYVCPLLIRGFGFESLAAHPTDLGNAFGGPLPEPGQVAGLGVEPRPATQWEREQAGQLGLHVTRPTDQEKHARPQHPLDQQRCLFRAAAPSWAHVDSHAFPAQPGRRRRGQHLVVLGHQNRIATSRPPRQPSQPPASQGLRLQLRHISGQRAVTCHSVQRGLQ
jgi:hypothetical protein